MADKGATLFIVAPCGGLSGLVTRQGFLTLASLVLDASIRPVVVLIVFDKFRNNAVADM